MSRIGEAASSSSRPQGDVFHGHVDPARAHQEVLRGLDGKQACPFCGSVSERSASPCARCGMDNTPEARKATKQRIGPWYVLQARNPAAPGMRFETLLSFVRKGRVRARSVVRGPTTHQLWRFAAHVKGLSREFGMCFSCGSAIETTANICPQCNRLQEPPVNPDVLLENDPEESSALAPRQPVYRELPDPAQIAAPEPQPAAPPPPEDVDIIIPALGGFGLDDPDPKFSEAPVAAPPLQDTFSAPPLMSAPVVPPTAPAPKPTNRPAPRRESESNPFAISGPRRKGNGGGASGDAASFLSAKELAAAFKLSFDPSAQMETVEVPDQMPASALPDGMRPSAIIPRNPMGLAAQPAAHHDLPRRGGAFKKFVLFVLILAGTGFGVLMWVDPGARQRTIDWTKSTYNRLHRYATGADGKPAPSAEANAPGSIDEIPDPPAPKAVPPPTAPAENAQTAPAAADDSAGADAPENNPPVEQPAPRPAPPALPKPKAEPAPEKPVVDKVLNPEDRMLELRTASYAASKKGDYKTALKRWEEMGELPEQYRDTLYQTRLKYLREQVE